MAHAIGRGGGEACCSLKTAHPWGMVGMAVACVLAAGRAAAAPVSFDIAPQDLSKALIVFSDQAHLRMTVAPDIADGRTAPALKGTFEPADALRRLLGADLTFEFIDSQDVVVEPRKRAAVTPPLQADPPADTAGVERSKSVV